MNLTAMICPNCKGSLAVDKDKNTVKCEYCGTPFMTEDVINYNRYEYKTTIQNVENLTLNDSQSIENQLLSARTSQYKFENYEMAFDSFKYISKIAANDFRGWLGLAVSSASLYLLTTNLDLYSCNDCGSLIASDTMPKKCHACPGHIRGHSLDWDFSKDGDIHNRINKISEIQKYLMYTDKVAPNGVKKHTGKAIDSLTECLHNLQELKKLRGYSQIEADINNNNYKSNDCKEKIKKNDEYYDDKMLKYFLICFAISFVLFLLCFTGASFFIICTIISVLVSISGLVITGLIKSNKKKDLLSQKAQLDSTLAKLNEELKIRADRRPFDEANKIIKEVSQFDESLFDMS